MTCYFEGVTLHSARKPDDLSSKILVPRLEVDHQRVQEKIPRWRHGQSSQCGFLYASKRCTGKQQTGVSMDLLDHPSWYNEWKATKRTCWTKNVLIGKAMNQIANVLSVC